MKFKVLENSNHDTAIVEADFVIEMNDCTDEKMDYSVMFQFNEDYVMHLLKECATNVANELVKKASDIGITVVPNTFRGKLDFDYDYDMNDIYDNERHFKVWFWINTPTDEETLKKLNSLNIGFGGEDTIGFDSYEGRTEHVTVSYGTGDTIIKEYRD